MRDFRNIKVWEKAHGITVAAYRVTKTFPREERYGLSSQIRRAAASIGANIAEGCCRGSTREFVRFLYVALASASELEYHLLLAADLEMLPRESHEAFTDRCAR